MSCFLAHWQTEMQLLRRFAPEGWWKQRGGRRWIQTRFMVARDFREMLSLVRRSLFVQSLWYLNGAVLSIRYNCLVLLYNSHPEVLLFNSGGFTRCVLIHTHPADIIQDRLCLMLTSLIVKIISIALLSLMTLKTGVMMLKILLSITGINYIYVNQTLLVRSLIKKEHNYHTFYSPA